jgi:hypothetical protein
MEIDGRIGCTMSGLIADARALVEHARVKTQVLFLCGLKFFYLQDFLLGCVIVSVSKHTTAYYFM